jgi:hypothetical protein
MEDSVAGFGKNLEIFLMNMVKARRCDTFTVKTI